ncbi:MAG: hypothetical protein ACI4M3_00540 [Acutalibacteraceae bacterium]
MDDFIIENSAWFENMGVAVVIFIVLAIIFFILAIAFKNQKTNLKSRKKKSAFARAYADIAVSGVDNSIQRFSESDAMHQRKRAVGEPPANYQQQNIPQYMTNYTPQQREHKYGNHVIEVCFEYEDEYEL